jgi:hypothetical protein
MHTKTQEKIIELFASKLNENFSINEISKLLKKPYALVYRSIIPLIKEEAIIKDKRGLLKANYKNQDVYSLAEIRRKQAFLSLNTNSLRLFLQDLLNIKSLNIYSLILFGSSVEKQDSRDYDILAITSGNVDALDKVLVNISGNFSKKFDINVISLESAFELLSKDKNILTETLNKHIILFGAENYYNLLKNAKR